MNLKNYTSGVPVHITIGRIEKFLIDTGLVSGISKEYKGSQVQSIVFLITYDPTKLPMTVKLPANVYACQDAFWADYKAHAVRPRKSRADFYEQAERTAWKLQQDWVEVQTALIRLKQQDAMQAFLAYAWNGQETFYQQLKSQGYRALLAAPQS